MIDLSTDLLQATVAEAALAPSVHNVQPSRWRIAGDRLLLLGDPSRAIPVADPTGRDWRLSHGAHLEGLSLALAARGAGLDDVRMQPAQPASDGLVPIADCLVTAHAAPASQEPVEARRSWRGTFKPVDPETSHDLKRLAAERDDCALVTDRQGIEEIAGLADLASLHFLRQNDHRAELRDWMRLSRAHPRYTRDGLNAEAMHLSSIEAWGAGLVLGPLFRPLDRVGLAASLVSEAGKTSAAAAAIVLFHRPIGEDAFVSGRAFYRAWLAMERCGLKGCPMSVLVDWDQSRETLAQRHAIASDRHLVSAFRIGRPDGTPRGTRARLPVNELIV